MADVAGGSAAETAGFAFGDVIISIDGQVVDSFAGVAAAAKRAFDEERELAVLVLRLFDREADHKATFHLVKVADPETEVVGAMEASKAEKSKKKAVR